MNTLSTQKPKKGFTLIETMIAIAILSVSIAGPLFTASRALVAAEISRDQLTASLLAQEGIEHVHWMRDDAYLNAYYARGTTISDSAWTDFTNGTHAWSIKKCVGNKCTLDPVSSMTTSALAVCTGTCSPLYLRSDGIYTQNSSNGTKTPFTRFIQVTAISSTEEQAVSTVSWMFHNTQYKVTLTDTLTPWQ